MTGVGRTERGWGEHGWGFLYSDHWEGCRRELWAGACRRQVGRRGDEGTMENEAGKKEGRFVYALPGTLPLFTASATDKLQSPLHAPHRGQIRRSAMAPSTGARFGYRDTQ